jgi:hypothetical protein
MAGPSPAPESRARLDDPDTQAVPGQGPPHEHDVALDPADPLAAEGEVVDDQIEDLTTPRFRHD